MTSAIDVTKPTHVNPQTGDVRSNFKIASDEINDLQASLRTISIDGGGAITVYEIQTFFIDGGTSSVVADQTFDSNIGNFILNGGNA